MRTGNSPGLSGRRLKKWILLTAGLLAGAIGLGEALAGQDALMPLDPPAEAGALAPGLEVLYFYGKFRHIDQMPTGREALQDGQRGQPFGRRRFTARSARCGSAA